jgi:hypothetical protein
MAWLTMSGLRINARYSCSETNSALSAPRTTVRPMELSPRGVPT